MRGELGLSGHLCTVAHNRTRTAPGGGIWNRGTLVITNTTIAENSNDLSFFAPGGDGIANDAGTLLVINSTLADNFGEPSFGRGGGILNLNESGTVLLQNTLLARNTEGTGPDCSGPVTSLGHNLIGDPTGCTITLLSTDLTGDPGLGDFIDDGTPGNGHFPLLPGSPAIDAGNDAVCPRFDQLGEPRMGPCDIGAIEFQGKHRKRH
jgi:hypothetical protein